MFLALGWPPSIKSLVNPRVHVRPRLSFRWSFSPKNENIPENGQSPTLHLLISKRWIFRKFSQHDVFQSQEQYVSWKFSGVNSWNGGPTWRIFYPKENISLPLSRTFTATPNSCNVYPTYLQWTFYRILTKSIICKQNYRKLFFLDKNGRSKFLTCTISLARKKKGQITWDVQHCARLFPSTISVTVRHVLVSCRSSSPYSGGNWCHRAHAFRQMEIKNTVSR